MNRIIAIMLLISTAAVAEEKTPYDEPPDGPISQVGTVIETQDIRCEVKSPLAIQCINIGRVCRAYRAERAIDYRKTFGCALEDSPNHPCPPWDERTAKIKKEIESGISSMCTPLMMGGF